MIKRILLILAILPALAWSQSSNPPGVQYARNASGIPIELQNPGNSPLAVTGALDIRAYGAKSDCQAVYDATTTNAATTTITSATATFKASDVGKRIATLQYADTAIGGYGTIASYISPTSVTATLNSAPGALTNAIIVWGTDDATAVNAALTAAKNGRGAVFVPGGITCVGSSLTIPVGVRLFGIGNYSTGGKAKDFKYSGSSIVGIKFAAGGLIVAGDSTGTDPEGTTLDHINIDAFGEFNRAYDGSNSSRTSRIEFATLLRGVGETIYSTPTSIIQSNSIFGQNQAANVVAVQGDSRFINNIVTGAGNGFYAIKLSNADDVVIALNHTWKDSSLNTMLGGQIFVSQNTGNVLSGGITIVGNKFDTSYGPHVFVKVSGNSTLRGINISDNHGFQNDSVPAATYPWMQLEVDSGSTLRAFTMHNNLGRASFNGTSFGSLTYFIDGGLIAGTIVGSSLTGNIMDNCAAAYNVFTPAYSAGNYYIVGSGTTATAF